MNSAINRKFPHVQITARKNNVEGMAAIAMKSLLKGDLLVDRLNKGSGRNYLDKLNPNFLHQARRALIASLSGWSCSPVLELRICTFPNLQHRAQSRITTTLCLRVRAKNEETVKEKVYTHYLALAPLLLSHIPEAEFVPVVDENAFRQLFENEVFRHALAVCRQKETIELTTPFGGLKNNIGFAQGPSVNLEALVANHVYPLVPSQNDYSRLLNTMMGQLDPVQIVIRIKPSRLGSSASERLRMNIRKCEMFLTGSEARQLTLRRQAEALRDVSIAQLARLKEASFKLGVFVFSSGLLDSTLGHVLGQSITEGRFDGENGSLMTGGFATHTVQLLAAEKMSYFSEAEPVTATEAACCFRLPSPPTEMIPGLPIRYHRTSLALLPDATKQDSDETIRLFDNVHQGMRQPIDIGLADRLRHIFVLGQTGTGKSTFMESMILQDIRAGRGIGVIDPHGELVDSIIARIPDERAKDVIILDLLDRKRPVGFNLLEWRTDEERDLAIDELYLTIDRIYDLAQTGGPIYEHNFRGMLGLLLGDKHREEFTATLLDFIPCYQNRKFRTWLLKTIDDPQIVDFINELENTGGEGQLANLSPYITSKFTRFVSDKTLRRIVGQPKTSFDFDTIMNEGKIFLIKLGKGRFGSNISALIANQLVSRFKLAAMKRGEMKHEDRREFFLYVDEAHNLPGDNFMELLSEARKYKMGLILATQYMAQLRNNTGGRDDLLSAIIGNVGTTLTFRLGQEDASTLAPALHPSFSASDIAGLPNFQGYAKMQLGNEATLPFSFMSLCDESAVSPERAKKIITYSRLKYGKDAQLVDVEIKRRRSEWAK